LNKTSTFGIVLLAGIFVGFLLGINLNTQNNDANPETLTMGKHPLQDETIQIGYIASSNDAMWFTVPLVEEIILPDINEFSHKLGYNVRFEAMIDSADDQAAIHLEKVQGFNTLGLDVFRGGPWSSMAQSALSYVNDNDMLMVSPSSTSPLLAIPDDRLYRLCPTDLVQAPVLAEMWDSWGAEAIIVFQRGDSWGDGVYNLLEKELNGRGISIIKRIRFAPEVMEFSTYLELMDEKLGEAIEAYGAERVGVQLLTFSEEVILVTQTPDYPNTREVIWMGAEGSGRSQMTIDACEGLQVKLRIFSPLMVPVQSWKWRSLEDRFRGLTALPADFYIATDYDTLWLIALGILETGSAEAGDVDEIFLDTARNYWGASGWVDLDDNGDRKIGSVFEIYGFTDDGFQIWGQCDGAEMKVTWHDDLLMEAGIVRPGHD
jgi:branched-chain amino acid transport system substrate-binding protein